MFEAAVIIMTVMGCGDQVTQCEVIAGPARIWHSQSECDAAIPGVLRNSTDAYYPVFTGRCDVPEAQKTVIAATTQQPFGIVRVEPAVAIVHDTRKFREQGQDRSLASDLLYRTKNGYVLVREGALGGFALLRNGAASGYSALHRGVRASIDGTITVAKRTAGAVRTSIVP